MRKLQFKFPNQIRISGWDFGSSARAMNQAGGFISTQADLEKVSRSTTERKSMSTKTTIKRIALVAVSALGLGVLTSVSPAIAGANANITDISAGSSAPARVGVVSGATTITLTHASSGSSLGTDTITAQIAAAPSTSANAKLAFSNSVTAPAASVSATDSTKTDQAADSNAGVARVVVDQRLSKTTTAIVLTLNADVAGTYQILVTADAASAAGYSAGKKSVAYSITTAGTPTAMTLTAINSTTYDNDSYGSLVKVTMKDAAGNATSLGLNESLTLTSASSSTVVNYGGSTAALSSSDFTRGFGMFRVTKDVAADTDDVITVAGSGLLSSTFNSQIGIKILVADALDAADTLTVANATSTYTYGTLSTNAQPVAPTKTGYGLKATPAPTAGFTTSYSTKAVFTDTSGLITGIVGAQFTKGFAAITGTASISVTGGVALGDGGKLTIVFEGVTRDYTGTLSSTSYTIGAISPASVTSATGAKNTFTAKVTDDYGVAVAGAAIVGSISAGRNVASTAVNMISDANGFVTYSITDAGTSGTSDTVQFARSGGGGAVTATITYGTVAVSTVTIKGGDNTTTGVAATTPQYKDIDAGIDGPSTTTHSAIATVKDANGVLLAGVPVTFTVAGTGVDILSTKKTVYTGSDGTATSEVYAWIAGKYTVTATAGGKTGTADYQFRQSAAGEERTISASVSGNIVTAKAVDRFGNPVQGVTIYATQTGGVTINSKTRDSGTTDTTGTVEFIISGTGTVSVSTISWTSVAGTYGSGQTSAPKGYVANSATAAGLALNAFTAYTAGTVTVAEDGVGASFDAAGVATASVDVTTTSSSDAVDAANDAVEAANAATDAANAAAEAADAATAAAQDAQAAVADLAAQVATLISGIKAQITRLTNLVIKIQKKVNA